MNAPTERPENSVDPKLLEILVCPLTKGLLEFDSDKQELISRSRKARLSHPRRHSDHAAGRGAQDRLIGGQFCATSAQHSRCRPGESQDP